jgi:hypothetical protein
VGSFKTAARMSNEPSAEDKARYETIRKELMQALPKKRAVDKQLVSLVSIPIYSNSDTFDRHTLKFKYTTLKGPT